MMDHNRLQDEDLGRNFRFVGNIYKDPAVLLDPEEEMNVFDKIKHDILLLP